MLTEGTLIDNRYRVLGPLGSGGMADVYLADDTHLGRRVAVKVMHDQLAQDPEFVQRFDREASAAAGLQHKNVVGVYDRGHVGATRYIVMEYLDGRTLKDVIAAQGAMQPVAAIDLTEQLLAASRFAHQRGVIHRDLKPQNVIVDADGNAKVTDFGIAHQPASDVTQAGVMLGTAQYISPEQAQGQPPQATSDLYSIGVMLFEMLTGRVPFSGDSSVAIALKHINEQPPRPSAVNPSVPPVLDEVVLRALAKDPNLRFRSGEEFSAALMHARATITGTAQPGTQTMIAAAATQPMAAAAVPAAAVVDEDAERAKRRKRMIWIGVGVVGLLLAAAALFFLLQPSKVSVPYVVGRSLDDAQAKLTAAGLESKIVKQRNAAPAGEVVAQDPQRGEQIDEGSSVLLTVSTGPGTVNVPSVRGLSQSKAVNKLRALGLEVDVQNENSPKIDKGKAIRTVPPAGEAAERGSSVDLFISDGPKKVAVPDVVGLSKSDAKTKLTEAGFEVEFDTESSPEPKNEVTEQTPAGGGQANEGSTVQVTVASGSNTVPNVVGLSEDDATDKLQDAGFQVTADDDPVDDESEAGDVQSQAPGANSVQELDSVVTISVGVFSGG